MIDIPGTFEQKHIYAIETAPEIGIEVPNSHAGLSDCAENAPPDCVGDPRHHPTEPWRLFLIDDTGKPDPPGCNSFEAVAKCTSCGATRYYPGGVTGHVFANKDDVLKVFRSLSWVDVPDGVCTLQGDKDVHVYPLPGVNPPVPGCP